MCEVFNLAPDQLICNYKPVLSTARQEDINSESYLGRDLASLQRNNTIRRGFQGSDTKAISADLREVFPNLIEIETPPISAERCLVCNEPLHVTSSTDNLYGVCSVCGSPYSKQHNVNGKVWTFDTWTLGVKPEWLQTFRSYWKSKRMRIPPMYPLSSYEGIPQATSQETLSFSDWMNQKKEALEIETQNEFRDSLNALA